MCRELAQKILYHKKCYYRGEPEISDAEYDELEEKLKKKNPNHPVLKQVGFIHEENKIPHQKKMLSLDKVYEKEKLYEWQKERELVSTFKIDGMSASLVFEEGFLKRAKTRGDGEYGENILEKALHIENIPAAIKEDVPLEVRGEIFCTKESFKKISEAMKLRELPKPSSQRNIVAGLLSRKDHSDLCRFLSFYAFEVLLPKGLPTEMAKYQYLQSLGFETPKFQLHQQKDSLEESIKEAELFIHQGNYLIDGLVFTFNENKWHEELGETAHHPRYKMAFKFRGETATTKIKKIEWNVSRNGILTPVALVEGVSLSGATIQNVTLHNLGMVRTHEIKEGDFIEITRSGEVIPKYLRTVKKSSHRQTIPTLCPSCSQLLKEEDIRLICINEDCSIKKREEYLHFIKQMGIDDVSTKRLDQFISAGLIKSYSSFYHLTKEQLLSLEQTKEKLATKILTGIKKSKTIKLSTFLTALGIKNLGRTSAEKIINSGYDTIEKVLNLTPEDLIALDGFAEKTASEIIRGIEVKEPEITKLLECNFSFQREKRSSTSLEKTFCFTGSLQHPRKYWQEKIKEQGGRISSNISSKTDYLVTNEINSQSSKFKLAEQYKIKKISEEELADLLGV